MDTWHSGIDKENETIQILIGKNEFTPKDNTLLITGLNQTPYLLKQGTLRVIAERIPNSGWQELRSTQKIMDTTKEIKNDVLELNFPELAANEALIIKLKHPDK